MKMTMSAGVPGSRKNAGSKSEFEGYVECPLFSDDAKITVDADEILIAARFDQLFIVYGELIGFRPAEGGMELQTTEGLVIISRMGQAARWLYDKLYAAYNKAVLKSLLVEGSPVFEAECSFIAEEDGITRQGQAVVQLYADCLCLLPPDEGARRIPLCFLTGVDQDGFSLVLSLSTGERFTVSRLGRGLGELDRLLTDGLRSLQEQTLAGIKKMAPNISPIQAAMAAKLMPFGTAAGIEKMHSVSPQFAAVLEKKIGESRMAQTYPWLQKFCGGYGLMAGVLPSLSEENGPEQQALSSTIIPDTQRQAEREEGELEEKEPNPILWVIAPDTDCRAAAVELALADDEAAATYVYRVTGKWETFSIKIDRALEAAGFRREVILLPNEKLNTPEYLAAAMLVRRTPALALLRSCFLGRGIHTSHERWLRDIEKCLRDSSMDNPPVKSVQPLKYCKNCGAKLNPDVRFCGQCGLQL